MSAYVATTLICWGLRAARHTAQTPGRQHLLMGLAATLTVAMVLGAVLALLRRVAPALEESRQLDRYCAAAAAGLPVCYRLEADGRWLEAVQQSAGWIAVRTVADDALSGSLALCCS